MDYFHCKRFLDTLVDWETGPPPAGPPERYLPRMRALLRRLADPQKLFFSIVVGGTNGKGTVGSLLAALLRASGRRVGLYTSPHLHSLRERIRIDGEILGKDLWATGVEQLYDRTRDFGGEHLGAFSKFEALTGLAAHLFARQQVEYAIFEVGLGGRYDSTNAWDSQVAVLTSVGLDHVQILGGDLLRIAADKLGIARPGRPLFTTAAQTPEVLDYVRRTCGALRVPLYVAQSEGIEVPEGAAALAYAWRPGPLAERPCTYLENARLALAVGAWVLGPRIEARKAQRTVEEHRWPGRFEVARRRPLVLLDGAHNPPGAVALAADLRRLAPQWTFVLGVNEGHDAAGILRALEPLARRVLLTTSDHPRALSPAVLHRSAQGSSVEECPSSRRAFERALGELRQGESLCVTGSLHLVARAREFFGLPHEREGISEEMVRESLECIEAACRRRGVACARVSADGNVLCVGRGGASFYFWRNKHPFNDYVGARLAEDKAYQYELFARAGIAMPATMQVFNPFADDRFNRYKTHRSIEEMAREIERRFTYPLLVKKYRSSVSQGVYLEQDPGALRRRLRQLFENSGFSDNILLIQSFVEGPEYRIVASQDEVLLAYEKRSAQAEAREDLNPLHQAGGEAVKVEAAELLEPMGRLTRQIAGVIELGLYAVDLIRGAERLYVLEINPNPFCFFYNRSNGRGDFVRIYERLIEKYVEPCLFNEDTRCGTGARKEEK